MSKLIVCFCHGPILVIGWTLPSKPLLLFEKVYNFFDEDSKDEIEKNNVKIEEKYLIVMTNIKSLL